YERAGARLKFSLKAVPRRIEFHVSRSFCPVLSCRDWTFGVLLELTSVNQNNSRSHHENQLRVRHYRPGGSFARSGGIQSQRRRLQRGQSAGGKSQLQLENDGSRSRGKPVSPGPDGR